MTDDPRPTRLLFVCSGNQCRSPLAAGIAEQLALELGFSAEIRSAGTLGIEGVPAHRHIVAVAREIGIDLAAHRSRALTPALLRWADRVFVMEESHGIAVRDLVPEIDDARVVPLGPLAGQARIVDPIGAWLRGPYRTTRDELQVALRRAFTPRGSPSARAGGYRPGPASGSAG